MAIKSAIDGGDLERTRARLDVLAPPVPRSGGAVVSPVASGKRCR